MYLVVALSKVALVNFTLNEYMMMMMMACRQFESEARTYYILGKSIM